MAALSDSGPFRAGYGWHFCSTERASGGHYLALGVRIVGLLHAVDDKIYLRSSEESAERMIVVRELKSPSQPRTCGGENTRNTAKQEKS